MKTNRPQPVPKLDIDQMFQPSRTVRPRKEPVADPAPVPNLAAEQIGPGGIVRQEYHPTQKQFNVQSAIIGLLAGVVLCFVFMRSDGDGPTPGPNPGPSPTPTPVIDVTVDTPTVLVKLSLIHI